VEEKPGFITPPPGLIPSAPRETSETVRLGDQRRAPIPAFVPAVPGTVPPAAPTATEVPPPKVPPAEVVPESKKPKHADPSSDPQWTLQLHDGSVVHVSGSLVLGRDPARVDGWPDAGLLTINDPEKTVSKTHAALDSNGDDLVVVDLGSTNGVSVVGPGGDSHDLEPRGRASVAPGSTLELGQYRILVQRL
jgi:hypothetical protein